jgi:hypothetical protein
VQRHQRRPAAVLLGVFWAFGLLWVQPVRPVRAQEATQANAAPQLSDNEIEKFLTDARVVRTKNVGKGVTNSLRATLSDGTITHDAHIQIVDESRTTGPSARGTELNFRDSWMFNVAAYRIDRLIGLKLVPVSVERKHGLKSGAFTWWVDDVIMDEGERLKKDIQPPSPQLWNESMQLIRLFDQLIYNVDRNMGNLVITKDWRVWAIDHTRAFRLHRTLAKPANVTRCDRGVLDGLKKLDKQTLQDSVGKYLTNWERDALLSRRDEIVKVLEKSGDSALFDRKQ